MNRYFLTYTSPQDGYQYFEPFSTKTKTIDFIQQNKITKYSIHKVTLIQLICYLMYFFYICFYGFFRGVNFAKLKIFNDGKHNAYEPTDIFVLEKCVKNQIITKNSVIVDIGCGRGFTFTCLNKYFHKTMGVEFDKELYDSCVENMGKLNISVELLNADINDVILNDKITHIFLANPFYGETMEELLQQIDDRDIIIIYTNPVCSDLMYKYGYKVRHYEIGLLGVPTIIFQK